MRDQSYFAVRSLHIGIELVFSLLPARIPACINTPEKRLEASMIDYLYSFAICLYQMFRASPTWLSVFPVMCFILPSFKFSQACSCLSLSISIVTVCVHAHHVTGVRLAFILHFPSSQHQNHLSVVRPPMPKRPADDVCKSSDELVLLTGSHSPPREPTVTLARCIGETLPQLCTTETDFNAQSSVMLSSVSLITGSASSLSRAAEPFRESIQAPKISKADAREWLTAVGESVSTTSSSAELKAKLLHFCRDISVERSPLVVVNCMPQRVLAKFVKWIIFQHLQHMETTLDDIVSQLVDESSVESEVQPVSMHAASSSLL